ncbi:pif1, partial [Symbiodinium sp. CCMP2456]
MRKMLRARLRLPIAETLHIAHILAQTVLGFLTGANNNRDTTRKARAPWKSHIFAAKDGSGRKTVLNFFGRLEYQDGKRRRYINQQEVAAQFYHGRGTVHLHLLVWLQHVETVKLEDSISATVPVDNAVAGPCAVARPTTMRKPKYYDFTTEEDFCSYNRDGTPEGLRAYIKDVLSSLHCHVDVQMSDGRGLLLRYVSGYRFRVPVPWEGACPDRVVQYMNNRWRAEDMTLADFLRKTNLRGGVHRSFVRRHQQLFRNDEDVMEETLEDWVNNAPLQGDVAVAAIYLSRYNDRYYGQWVLMNVPFRSMDDLRREELDRVPPHLYYQALALLLRPDHWTSEAATRAELELEAFREHHIRNILAMLFANQGLIRKYLSGELDKNDDVVAGPADGAGPGTAVELSGHQQRLAAELLDAYHQGTQLRQQGENELPPWTARTSPFAPAVDGRSAYTILGPAGSGKTTTAHQVIRQVAANGRVLLTAPTGRLAATLRERFPDLEVDTVHGAFLVHKPTQEAMEVLWPYDLIVVEEVGQPPAADRIPTLIFVGDFYQLPGVDPFNALDSPLWHSVLVKKRELHTMLRCKCPKLREKLELLRIGKPTVRQLMQIKAGHKAPSLHRAGYVMAEEPSDEDIGMILEETPQTLFLTVSRRACAQLNAAAVTALFSDDIPL